MIAVGIVRVVAGEITGCGLLSCRLNSSLDECEQSNNDDDWAGDQEQLIPTTLVGEDGGNCHDSHAAQGTGPAQGSSRRRSEMVEWERHGGTDQGNHRGDSPGFAG